MTVRRKLLRLAFALALLLIALLLLCVTTVDYRPFLQQPWFTATQNRLTAITSTNHLTHGRLRAGFGQARLTPGINAPADDPDAGTFTAIPLAGYGDRRGAPATGTHDDLHVKAVALEVENQLGLMFGIDALIVPREVADAAAAQLREELGLRREQLYFSATHTHCSLGGWGEGPVGEIFAGDFNPAARHWFVRQIVAAARDAIADLEPASLGHNSFAAPEFTRNRLVGDVGRINPFFDYLVIRQENGATAILGSYSAHATVLPASVMQFSGDYPGYWARTVEEATGGMAIFLAGSVGSHAPLPGGKGFSGAENMGEALARKLLDQLETTPLTNQTTFGLIGLPVDLPPLHIRLTSHLRLRPWLARWFLPVASDTFLQALRVGDSLWISTPCDFSGELALDLKHLLQTHDLQATVTSFNGDYIGYVVPTEYYHLTAYESRIMNFFGPNTTPYLLHLIRGFVLPLAEPPPVATPQLPAAQGTTADPL